MREWGAMRGLAERRGRPPSALRGPCLADFILGAVPGGARARPSQIPLTVERSVKTAFGPLRPSRFRLRVSRAPGCPPPTSSARPVLGNERLWLSDGQPEPSTGKLSTEHLSGPGLCLPKPTPTCVFSPHPCLLSASGFKLQLPPLLPAWSSANDFVPQSLTYKIYANW